MAVVYIRPSKFCFLNQRTLVRAAALFLLLRFCVGAVSAQPSLARMRNEATVQETGPVFSLRISKNDPDIGVIRFSRTRPLPVAQALPWLETALAMRRGIDEWRPAGEMVTKDSLIIRRCNLQNTDCGRFGELHGVERRKYHHRRALAVAT